MSTAEAIYELVKTMPEEQATMVLVFAESLHSRSRVEPDSKPKLLSDFLGVLKDSPNFNGDPVEIQRAMRSEWD